MKIKLITDMFQMDVCDVSVSDDAIVISTPETERSILLADIENILITRHTGRNARLEISLNHEMVEGVFIKGSDADAFANVLKECMGAVLQINFHGQ